MLSKEKFVDYIKFVQKMTKSEERIYDVLSEEIPDFGGLLIYSKYEDKYVKLLEDVMEDENRWISYFLYDLEFGEKWKKGTVTENDGTDVPLGTPEDLYNILTKK